MAIEDIMMKFFSEKGRNILKELKNEKKHFLGKDNVIKCYNLKRFKEGIKKTYSKWITDYLDYCEKNREEAEEKIKHYNSKTIGKMERQMLGDYFKIFWYDAKNYIHYYEVATSRNYPDERKKPSKNIVS